MTANATARPYELMCIVCGLGNDEIEANTRLDELRRAIRANPILPLTLACHVDGAYRYQNPGRELDTPEGELFNEKRDLDILQRLGAAPGDTRPAVEWFERLLKFVPGSRGICGCDATACPTWTGCPRAASGSYERGVGLGLSALFPERDAAEKARFKERTAAEVLEADVLRLRPHHLLCMTCFHGGREEQAPIAEDNLWEAAEAMRRRPDIPVTLIRGCCMICPPCSRFDPKTGLCVGGNGMSLRDQKKDLDVLQRTGLAYGDTLPARELLERIYARIPDVMAICGYGDGEARSFEWSICGSARTDRYQKGRDACLGLRPPPEA